MKSVLANRFVFLVLSAAVSAGCATAYADDVKFIIKVPVDVTHLHPDVTDIFVGCTLVDQNNQYLPTALVHPWDNSNSVMPVKDGSRAYKGTVPWEFTVDEKFALKTDWTKVSYKCSLSFKNDYIVGVSPNSADAWNRVTADSTILVTGKVIK